MKKVPMYVTQLEASEQAELREELLLELSMQANEDAEPYEVLEHVSEAMDSKVYDLEDTVNIRSFLHKWGYEL